MNERRHFINTISREHVQKGMEGGFTQADHGSDARLRRMRRGDLIVFYSPRTALEGGEPLQAFTAIGEIVDDEPYQVEVSADSRPWRRRMRFFGCVETPIRPLIDSLEFIINKKSWGYMFRRGMFPIGRNDFRRIAEAMRGNLELEEIAASANQPATSAGFGVDTARSA